MISTRIYLREFIFLAFSLFRLNVSECFKVGFSIHRFVITFTGPGVGTHCMSVLPFGLGDGQGRKVSEEGILSDY